MSSFGSANLVPESGWPTAGNTNGAAVPSTSNQQTAVASLKSSVSDIVLFQAYNDGWKPPGPWNVEQHWGMYVTSSP